MSTAKKILPNVHPGEILLEDFLKPAGLSQYRLAKATGISESAISGIVNGTRSVTADVALRLARFWGTSAAVWTNLQAAYDLEEAERAITRELDKIRRYTPAAA